MCGNINSSNDKQLQRSSLPEEPGILSNNVHDVRSYDCLVVFALLLLAQPQQILRRVIFNSTTDIKHMVNLDHCHQEPLLILFMHGTGDGSNGPTKGVQILPRPFVTIDLNKMIVRNYSLFVISCCSL